MSILDQINSPDELKKLSIADLKKLAIEIRQELININKDHSIHLSSNLGIVEIAIGALLSFNVPTDKVFYDIGHQSYPHKLLTGRKDIVKRIRQDKGSSGFQSMQESIYDVYSTGHAGNSLSIAHGLQMQNQIDNKYGTYVVPIIGDGGIANGEAFEALNNIKADNARVIIILNDNGMSISKSVGALAKGLAKVKNSKLFFASERTAKRILAGKRPTSRPFQWVYNTYNWVERKITGKNIFQALGYQYIGPVDGNNIKKVILAMSKAKWYSTTGPVIVHFKTHKGLGLASAESDEVGNYHTTDSNANSFGLAACEYLKELAFTNKKIHIINPAMTHGTGFDDFAKTLPTQYHDVGIAEEHAVSFATGLHLNGLTPVVIQYSTFLQRAYDQIHHDAARLQLPILFLTDRADLSPSDGPTHHGIYDIGYLKSIPHTIITTSRNRFQLKQLIDLGLNNKQNPFFVRYPKAPFTSETYQTEFKVKFGEWEWMQQNNNKTCIISYGPYCDLIYQNINNKPVDLINAIFINKYSEDNLKKIFAQYDKVIVYERIFNNNTLASDLYSYAYEHNHNTKIISMSYRDYPGFGSLQKIDEIAKMTIKDILHNL